MATSNVQLTEEQIRAKLNEEIVSESLKDPVYVGKVTRGGVKNPITGEEITREAEYSLPIIQNLDEAHAILGTEQELLYWVNYGRKVAARAQVFAALGGLDLGDPQITDLYKSFTAAMDQLGKDMEPERLKMIRDMVLSEKKYAPLKKSMDEFSPEKLVVDFAQTEIKKSSGKRGAPKKNVEPESTES